MSRSIADALSLAMLAKREQNYARIASAAQARTETPRVGKLLPRGTNAHKVDVNLNAQAEQPKIAPRIKEKVDVNLHGYPANFLAHKRRLDRDTSPLIADVKRHSKIAQGIHGQAGGVKQHLMTAPPTRGDHDTRPTIPAHDRMEDWDPSMRYSRNRHLSKIEADAALRRALQEMETFDED